ncbi:hypothetical protein [Allomesorhizobium camelthorni]|uniref:Uncharacterized protein n=1 Tax=Allomesorhizobium camelthorni TaxID=475069 RepID=A0A6G4W8L5_9HYPH|nr:hypothetical protein [Mesorhizobium camelthorni]NGO51111.1 hypothetical protein [Mesorhizobium camelthorni]
MADEIFISMTGDRNELWAECLQRNLVALGFDRPYFEAWHAGDYEGYLALERAAASAGSLDGDIKARATLWFNRATRLTESEGDVWLHRDGNNLYWAETTADAPVFEPYDDQVMIAKPVGGWLRRNRKTVALTWNSIHPKAKDYLVTQQAIFRVANEDMKAYLRALIDGSGLDEWHTRPDWRERLGEGKGKSLGKNVELSEMAITRMIFSIRDTVKNSNGQLVLKTLKDKKLLCSEAEMRSHLADLMKSQQGLCAITKLPMHLDGQDGFEHDMLASADRIDSNGHYAIGNVQLVCRFVNFWKCAQENGRFVELLNRVVARRVSEGVTASGELASCT